MSYDPETGIAVWLDGRCSRSKRVGYLLRGKRSKPYRYLWLKEVSETGQTAFSHVVHFYMTGKWPAEEMDHINTDTADDRWVNLRESTRSQNEANRGPRRNNKLGIKGIFRTRNGKYFAKFWRGKNITVGTFDTAEAAKAALIIAVKPYDGEFFRA